LYTKFGGWFNFYLDDLFLFEEDVYVPAPEADGLAYLAFGKSTSTSSTDVEVEYIKVDNTGSYIHTAVFNSNGGSAVATQVVDGMVAEPAAPSKEGYAFAGWYSNLMLTSTYDFNTPVTTDLILYAKWNEVYTVTFNLDGGTGITDSTYTVESETLVLPIPTKVEFNFLGWYDNSELTGSAITEIPQGSTGNMEFWAKWQIATGLNDIQNRSLSLYPNPVTDGLLTIDNIRTVNSKIEIYSILGTLAGVYDIKGSKTEIDISVLPAGTYVVRIDSKVARIMKK
jgi:uncharacterized repeat protein (TIGR02543 family)